MLKEFKHHFNEYLSSNTEIKSISDIVKFNKQNSPMTQHLFDHVEKIDGDIASESHVANKNKVTATHREKLEKFMADNGLDAILASSSPDDFAVALPDFAGFPAINVPAGLDAKSTPQGVTLYAKRGQECTILALAKMLEGETALKRTSPTFVFSPEPTPIKSL